MQLNPTLQAFIDRICSIWPGYEAQIVREYRIAFKKRDAVLRDIAEFAQVNKIGVPASELERIEGRREVFRHIMAMQGIDPQLVIQFLEGDNLD